MCTLRTQRICTHDYYYVTSVNITKLIGMCDGKKTCKFGISKVCVAFWDVMPCGLAEEYHSFGRTFLSYTVYLANYIHGVGSH